MRVISGSLWRKVAALVIVVTGFVFLYETRSIDSTALQALAGDLQPDAGSRLPFNATAYCKGETTASGVVVRSGIAAADAGLLPVGSVLNVATGDSRYNGVYTVMDTGPKVQGRLLDLYMWSCHEALRFGRRQVQVTVLRLGWDPKASSPSLIDRLFRGREVKRRIPDPDAPPPASLPSTDSPTDSPAATQASQIQAADIASATSGASAAGR
ncbi:MAG TPA: 3D domain-containing protein [Vicinamibacterales bacterium]|jgi:3D (Asp-Asp-Asp) domain-containing protein|nr:3D domain-containing protein [Vicinamibacterales bacterium]